MQAIDAAEREAAAAPRDATAWERLGRLRMQRFDRAGARDALERARTLRPSVEGLLDLATIAHLHGDVGTEVSVYKQATEVRARLAARLVALRTRWRAPTAPRTASQPATARWRSATTRRSSALADSVRARTPRELAA